MNPTQALLDYLTSISATSGMTPPTLAQWNEICGKLNESTSYLTTGTVVLRGSGNMNPAEITGVACVVVSC